MTATATATATLVVEDFTWRPYGRSEPVLEVSLTVRPGERVLVLGPSGSGKSTLLRAMAGLLDDSLGEQQGSVTLGGTAPQAEPGRIGLMLQDPSHAWVAEHVGRDAAFGPENRRSSPHQVRTTAEQALTAVDFPYDAGHRTTALSGGQQQRLALAGALALNPDVLLLDEPTAMLDPPAAATVRAAVLRAADERTLTLVVVEHRLADWAGVCERTVVLDRHGRVLADGPTIQVLADQESQLLDAGIWVPGIEPLTVSDLRASDPVERSGAGPKSGTHSRSGGIYGSSATGLTDFGDGSAALELSGVGLTAPDGRELAADLTLTIEPGTFTVVTGPSGAGKSTLLHTVAGFIPGAGQVRLPGATGPIDARGLRRSTELASVVAWLPQHVDLLWTRRTVIDEMLATSRVLFAGDPVRLAAANARAETLLTELGLDHLREADPYQLSGGEQRRLALAAVIVHAPAVILLDEPTVGQDRHTWAAVMQVIDRLRAEGTVVLAATHDESLIAAADHRLAIGADRPPVAAEPADHAVREVVEPGAPPAARNNPLALLIVALGGVIGSFFVTDWLVGVLTLLVSVLLAPLAVGRRTLVPTLARLVPVALAALTVGWSTLVFSDRAAFSSAAFVAAAKEITRIACLVVPGVILVGVLDPSRLGDALAQRCRLPHRPVVAGTAALLRLQLLLDDWRRIAQVRRIRGLAPGRSLPGRIRHVASMTFTLLVHVLRQAQVMATSMDARGFAEARRRTFALPSPWRGRDWVAVAIALLLVAAPLLLSLR
ncbi:MAG: ATP-binding cassette domain-containing protein [Propionibacteriales bacterium]|nr:ATP-binding cassette domain-containing protein [Propionibacteriales bacterium]